MQYRMDAAVHVISFLAKLVQIPFLLPLQTSLLWKTSFYYEMMLNIVISNEHFMF